MLEWEELCFEDINLLSGNNSGKFDNLIFIQAKTKWWKDSTITKNDWIFKAIRNFVQNINFQKDKNDNNYLFFIFTNSKLSESIDSIKTHNVIFYISIVDDIIKDNNKRKQSKNLSYPDKTLNNIWINSNKTEKLLLEILYKKIGEINLNEFTDLYSEEYIKNLYLLVKDLQMVVNNLVIIKSIKLQTLYKEMSSFYWIPKYRELKETFEYLSIDKHVIHKEDSKFDKYTNYPYTYFIAKDWWKCISDIVSISKWKFVDKL